MNLYQHFSRWTACAGAIVLGIISPSLESVAVHGRATIDRRVRPGLELIFKRASDDLYDVARFTPDEAGRFAGTLKSPGEYVVSAVLNDTLLIGMSRVVEIADGPNEFDWDLALGEATFTIRNWDRAGRLTLDYRRVDPVDRTAAGDATLLVAPDSVMPWSTALPLGSYEVTASQTRTGLPPLVSKYRRFEISEDRREAQIELTLSTYTAAIVVRGVDNQPIEGPAFRPPPMEGPCAFS